MQLSILAQSTYCNEMKYTSLYLCPHIPQGNPVERFHPWPCCARGHRLVQVGLLQLRKRFFCRKNWKRLKIVVILIDQGSNGPVFRLSARVCQVAMTHQIRSEQWYFVNIMILDIFKYSVKIMTSNISSKSGFLGRRARRNLWPSWRKKSMSQRWKKMRWRMRKWRYLLYL